MKNIIILVCFGIVSSVTGIACYSMGLRRSGAIPTKYETGEIIKHKGRVFMLIEMQTEYRPLIPEEVSQ